MRIATSNKKILIISNSSWNIYNFRYSLAKYLEEQGFNIFLASSIDEYTPKLNHFKFYKIFLKNKSLNIFYEIKTIIDIILILTKIKPDIVLTFTIKPNFYLSLIKIFFNFKLITNITGRGDIFDSNNLILKIFSSLYIKSNNFSDFIFFQNSKDLNFFIKNKFKSLNYEILPGSGVNIDKFNLRKLKRNNNLKFLFASRLLKKKGILYFIKIATYFKNINYDFTFNVCGEFLSNKEYIDKLVFENTYKSKIIGYLKYEDKMHLLLKNYDFLIFPSSYNEGFPRIVIESFASGVIPIVSKKIGSLIKKYGDFYFLELDQEDHFVNDIDKIKNLKRDQNLKKKIENNFKLVKEKFDQKIVFDKYYATILNIYE